MNRVGVVHTSTPEQTDKELDTLFEVETKKIIHHPIVLFGRYHCIARAPKCNTCPIAKDCKSSKN